MIRSKEMIWSIVEKFEKLASIVGVVAVIVTPVLLNRLDDANRRADLAQRQFALVAGLGPLLLDSAAERQRFAVRVIAASGDSIATNLCTVLAPALGQFPQDEVAVLNAVVRECRPQLLATLPSQGSPDRPETSASTALTATLARFSTRSDLQQIADHGPSPAAETAARTFLGATFNVFVASYATAREADAAIPALKAKLAPVGLAPRCFRAIRPGGAWGITVTQGAALEAAQDALTKLHKINITGYLHGAASGRSDDTPELCTPQAAPQ